MKQEAIWVRPFYYLVVFTVATISIYPILLMILSSFKKSVDIYKDPLGIPSSFSLDTYRTLLSKIPFTTYFMNSLFVSVVSVVLIVVVCSLASFYIARFKFSWNHALFFIFLLGMMIPIKLGIVPLFILMRDLGLINSLWSLILMNTATGIPLSILILTGFFKTMPSELEEAARMDGAGNLRVLWYVVLPLMRPALGTVVIINFIAAWNDFFFPLIFITEKMKRTIPVGMMSLFGEHSADWGSLFAGLTLASLPMILLFFIASKQFMEGLTAGAIK
ncbi:carbohydrate ABC transporter permease [Lysinibacillus fusiformis]|jgi:raffinose/stachyose/melibiose transport system permease protein|uniref:carbohydrate ABC transporter permease n=1 Tax=Lysinibacillus TaxID=400634 RepID=UPI0004D494F1|nr:MULTISPECIES: carbohydrate ABC transporter permease [Lysinibacillus]MDC6269902.1 carbohydrate ABC transporter permease [Lysinibacillus sphaericus]AJK89706.1 sugar ABC transporter permease [Lysinibacillus fusiformis]KAB0441153.1 carbohydrate ABC transporter permease [Lysinibacillus fusiformis]KGA84885.1 sugar ABC transporter permease [Lysinibacillus fusiformis]KHK54358.1 sugar ABC transporter permease [Lysinibacillus sp. A1]